MQTFRMGNKQEMVVAVRAPEGKQGPIEVALTTDVAQDLFLHWGVRKQGGSDWVAPPKVQKPCNPRAGPAIRLAVETGIEPAVVTGFAGPAAAACHAHSSTEFGA